MGVFLVPMFLGLAQAAAPAPASGGTLQQRFDAASDAAAADRCEEAVAAFTAIEADPRRKASPTVAAAIQLRKGRCLRYLGRVEEAETALRTGLDVLGRQPAFAEDARLAHLALAQIAVLRIDYVAAQLEGERALALSTSADRINALLLLARTVMFDRNSQALAHADEALALVLAQPGASKDAIATVRTVRGRVLLNRGEHKAAMTELQEALRLQGGLNLRVSVADVITRSDLAIAALLIGNTDDARKYLAYTGAGRTPGKAPFGSATNMVTPRCSGEAGLKPDDRTVIEFRLNDDGTVGGVAPIYSTGGRAAAEEFARAVSDWTWSPESAAAVPAVFRLATRVELRCSTVGERPALTSVLEEASAAWFASKGLVRLEPGPDPKGTVDRARATLAATRPGDAARLPALLLMNGPALTASERAASAQEAQALAKRLGAPPEVIALQAIDSVRGDPDLYRSPRRLRERYRALLADPALSGNPHAGATLRLLIAVPGYRSPAPADADPLLQQIVADSRLPKDDPLRVAALLEQASRQSRAGQLDAARASFKQTGLSEQQCALVGVTPALKRTGAGSSDFPMEAMRWGFEGWVRAEFDVLADGRTAQQRAIVAYPPFVFNNAATGIAQGVRYEASYRPSGGTACTGNQHNIVFRLPG